MQPKFPQLDIPPQSNQRGIETTVEVEYPDPKPLPQSNQRGIETLEEARGEPARIRGLNRTSVGLKLRRLAGDHASRLSASIEPAWD